MCNDCRNTADHEWSLNLPLFCNFQKKPATSAAEYKKTDEPQPDVKDEEDEENEDEDKDEEPGIYSGPTKARL